LRSGDIVDIMDNGEITVVDRKKAIIITAGGKEHCPFRDRECAQG